MTRDKTSFWGVGLASGGSEAWDPALYQRFSAERRRPFEDLLAGLSEVPGGRVVDLGCGAGGLTRQLHDSLGAAQTLGIDSAPTMLRAAKACDNVRFERAEILEWLAKDTGTWDVVFSNAALHWLDDHPALFAEIAGKVAPGGQLAVQVPANHDRPTHTIADALAEEEPFASALKGYVRQHSVMRPEEYSRLLHELGFEEPSVRLVVYAHTLKDAQSVVDWVRGAALTAYARRLPPTLFSQFIQVYAERLTEMVGDEEPVFFPFKRILMWGQRPD